MGLFGGLLAALVTAATAQMPIAVGNAMTLPAQRHLVRIDPRDGQGAIWMLAIQQDGADGHGLGWFRSDDEAQTFQYVGPIQDDWSERDEPDLITVGNDIAMVFSYEGPTLSASSRHDVYFQWWRYQPTTRSWSGGPVLKIFDADSTHAYSRAEIARDGAGRIWVQAFRLETDGSSTATIAVSTDGGNTFSQLSPLDNVPGRGGGRLLWLGSELVFVYGLHDGFIPARMRIHRDGDAPGTWGPVQQAFDSGEGIYHGAALSAAADGHGGMHFVYKNENDERMYYRHFDGSQFGAPVLIDDSSDWALQPATTVVGDDLYVFYNHVYVDNTNYDWRYRRLHDGSFSAPVVLDSTQSWKGYPGAVEVLPSSVAQIPCFYGRTPDANSGGFEMTAYAPDVTVGATDAGAPDAGVPDAGSGGVDAGTPDAGVPDAGSGALFTDEFNRSGALGSNWTVASGSWTDNGSAATGTAAQSYAFWVGSPGADDTAAITISTPIRNTYTGVIVRATPSAPAANHYVGYVDPSGQIHVARRNSGNYTFLADGPAFPTGSHVLSLTATGTGPVVLSVKLDGAEVLRYSDGSSSALRSAGKDGIVDYNGAGQPIDRFVVTAAAAPVSDGGTPDAGVDAGTPDSGSPDAGTPDAGTVDAGAPDAGTPDAGTVDAGAPDAGTPDAGTVDAGAPDAGTPDAGTGTLFSDSFSRTTTDDQGLGANWVVSGLWYDNGQVAISDLDGADRATESAAICANCQIQAKLTGFGVSETAIFLRAPSTTSNDRYELRLSSNGHIQIERVRSGTVTVLGDAASGIPDLTEPATLALTASGNGPVQLSASVNGMTKLTVTDSSTSALIGSGYAGLYTTSAGVWFDDVKLTGTGSGASGSVGSTGPDAGTPDAGTPDAGTPAGTPDAGTPDAGTVSGTQLTLTPVYTDTSKIFLAVDPAGTAYSVSLSDQSTLLASSDAKSWSTRGRHPAGAAFFLISPLSDGTLLADVIHDGSHHLARSTDHGASWADVLDFNGYRMLTPHNVAELDGAVYVLEYQDFTESSTTIRLWMSTDDGQTWSVRHQWTTHRHGHGLIADPAHHALWAVFGDTDPQCAVELSTDDGANFTVMLTGQQGDVVDGVALSDGSILFGQDISYLPPTPHIARLTMSGGYTEIAGLTGPSYAAHTIRSGGYIISAEREPGGDIYPSGEISAHVYGSVDGTHWTDLLDYPWGNSNDIVRADVYFELPNGLQVLQLYNANGFGPQGYQLLQVGTR